MSVASITEKSFQRRSRGNDIKAHPIVACKGAQPANVPYTFISLGALLPAAMRLDDWHLPRPGGWRPSPVRGDPIAFDPVQTKQRFMSALIVR
jgi:hypothetical protein